MPRQIQGSQTDFSAGEVDVALKRADQHPVHKAGARQLSNYRILNSNGVQNRPGRGALFFEVGRVEQVLMSPGNTFYLAFGNGYLKVYNNAGTQVFGTIVKGDAVTLIPWNSTNIGSITWAIDQFSIYIAYGINAPNNVPQILTWDGVSQTSTWTLTTYAETITSGGQKRTLFDRISPPNITLQPSAQTGTINVVFSGPVLFPGMVGTRITYCGRQITIASITDTEHGTATVNEPLVGSESLPFASSPVNIFNVGDEAIGSISGAKGIVLSVAAGSIGVQLIPPNVSFISTDTVVGPGGSLAMSAGASAAGPGAVTIWNDEVMNTFRGYPSSVTLDQGRLVFSNFPALPGGLAWSSIGLPGDFYVEPTVATVSPDSAIFEIAPGKSQVLYVIPGMESSEFIFCDNAIYFIAISVSNPLVPGSVVFTELSANGCFPGVQPRRTEQTIIYMRAGGIQVCAVQVPGAFNRPYIVDNVSDLHSHLFIGNTPLSIAIPSSSTQFEELYIYIAFTNGSMAVGKYSMKSGLIGTGTDGKPNIGWVPWSGAGTVLWAAAQQSNVIFCTLYTIAGSAAQAIIEQLDNTQYLDQAVFVNNLPVPLRPSGGLGPLWFIAGGSVTLMDQGARMMGTYQVDATGHIIPQNNDGENLASAQLVAGQPWTAILEPFAQDASSGSDMHQRMLPRRISYFAVYVVNSTGLLLAKLFSSKLTPTSPALGTIMNTRRVPAWNQGDDPTQPPPLRETVEEWRPSGYSYDPRVALIKDTPGPLQIQEVAMEISI